MWGSPETDPETDSRASSFLGSSPQEAPIAESGSEAGKGGQLRKVCHQAGDQCGPLGPSGKQALTCLSPRLSLQPALHVREGPHAKRCGCWWLKWCWGAPQGYEPREVGGVWAAGVAKCTY